METMETARIAASTAIRHVELGYGDFGAALALVTALAQEVADEVEDADGQPSDDVTSYGVEVACLVAQLMSARQEG